MKTEEIAKLAHELKVIVHQSHGDNTIPAWENLTEEQRQMTIRDVEFRLINDGEFHGRESINGAYDRIVSSLKVLQDVEETTTETSSDASTITVNVEGSNGPADDVKTEVDQTPAADEKKEVVAGEVNEQAGQQ